MIYHQMKFTFLTFGIQLVVKETNMLNIGLIHEAVHQDVKVCDHKLGKHVPQHVIYQALEHWGWAREAIYITCVITEPPVSLISKLFFLLLVQLLPKHWADSASLTPKLFWIARECVAARWTAEVWQKLINQSGCWKLFFTILELPRENYGAQDLK